MPDRAAGWTAACLMVGLSMLVIVKAETGVGDDLTERLAGEADSVENVLGAHETEALVVATLRRVQAKQRIAEKAVKLAEEKSATRSANYESSLKAAAEKAAEKRSLEAQLALISETEKEDSELVAHSRAVAESMRVLEDKAAAKLRAVRLESSKAEEAFKQQQQKSKAAEKTKKEVMKQRELAEHDAKLESSRLAQLDLKISGLLDHRSQLKQTIAKEDKKVSTSLVQAFESDASRQERFREALRRQREEQATRKKQDALQHLQFKHQLHKEMQTASIQIRSAAADREHALSALFHRIWLQNPDLHELASSDKDQDNDQPSRNADPDRAWPISYDSSGDSGSGMRSGGDGGVREASLRAMPAAGVAGSTAQVGFARATAAWERHSGGSNAGFDGFDRAWRRRGADNGLGSDGIEGGEGAEFGGDVDATRGSEAAGMDDEDDDRELAGLLAAHPPESGDVLSLTNSGWRDVRTLQERAASAAAIVAAQAEEGLGGAVNRVSTDGEDANAARPTAFR